LLKEGKKGTDDDEEGLKIEPKSLKQLTLKAKKDNSS
jgi:hypothetical protein